MKMHENPNRTEVEIVTEELLNKVYTYTPNQDRKSTQVKVAQIDKVANTITLENTAIPESKQVMPYSAFLALNKSSALVAES